MIAIALTANPKLMIVDEPTSELSTSQRKPRFLKLIRRLVQGVKVSIFFISHDFAVIAQIADRVAVTYTRRIVEKGTAIFEKLLHEHTELLLSSYSGLEASNAPLKVIPDQVRNLTRTSAGCPFATNEPLRRRRTQTA